MAGSEYGKDNQGVRREQWDRVIATTVVFCDRCA